jgi:hypothetical protein
MFEKLMRRKNAEVITRPTGAAGTPKDVSGGQRSNLDITKSRKAIEHIFGIDTDKVAIFAGGHGQGVLAVVRIIVCFAFLVRLIGWIPLGAGLCSWAIILPLGTSSTKRYSKAQQEWINIRDRKQAIVSEAINGIRQIKFSARELQWEQRIVAVREKELCALWQLSLANIINTTCWLSGPIALAAVSLSTYAMIYGRLLPSFTFGKYNRFRPWS